MPFILDASVAASWAFKDKHHPVADAALAILRIDSAAVPGLWWYEVRNALLVGERHGRLTEALIAGFLRGIGAMQITADPLPNSGGTLDLARRYRLTIYDAAYLELAVRRGEPLATLDKRLASAALAESVALIGAP